MYEGQVNKSNVVKIQYMKQFSKKLNTFANK